MKLHDAQKKIAESTARFRVANCGRRFGKTMLAAEEIKGIALANDDARIVYIATTFKQARDIIWLELIKSLGNAVEKTNESRLELTVTNLKGGTSRIQLQGWESIQSLRGQKFDFMCLDEVASMRNFWVNFQEVLIPTLTDNKGSALFISTPVGFNHFYDLYNMQDESDNWQSFHFTTYDNPHMDAAEIDELKKSMTPDAFAQEYMADFRKQTGLVYKEFQRQRHTYANDDVRIDAVETLAGVDFGFTNPTCVLTMIKDRDGKYWITDEWYKTGQTHAQIAEYVVNQEFNKVYADPASPEAIEELKKRQINVYDVNKGADSIVNGIQKVRELFKQGRIKIHTSCSNLISELETYAYPEKKANHSESETPMKENDHAMDALRYALMTNQPEVFKRVDEINRAAIKRMSFGDNHLD